MMIIVPFGGSMRPRDEPGDSERPPPVSRKGSSRHASTITSEKRDGRVFYRLLESFELGEAPFTPDELMQTVIGALGGGRTHHPGRELGGVEEEAGEPGDEDTQQGARRPRGQHRERTRQEAMGDGHHRPRRQQGGKDGQHRQRQCADLEHGEFRFGLRHALGLHGTLILKWLRLSFQLGLLALVLDAEAEREVADVVALDAGRGMDRDEEDALRKSLPRLQEKTAQLVALADTPPYPTIHVDALRDEAEDAIASYIRLLVVSIGVVVASLAIARAERKRAQDMAAAARGA